MPNVIVPATQSSRNNISVRTTESRSSLLLHLQSYVEEIAVLLLQDSPSAECRALLDRLTSETSVLIGIIKAMNPQAFSVFNCGDKGQGGTPGLDDTFYSKLAVS